MYSELHRNIIEQSKDGNRRAQQELYTLYSKAMFNICLRMMNSREEAEDALQEAFCDAFHRLNTFRFESAFGAWLKRIVINRCINALKKKKADLVLCDDVHAYDRRSEEAEEPEYSVDTVYKAMGLLPDGYRVVFSLYLLEGYDHQEIAQILGVSVSTSKSQYMRAKSKIKELIKEVSNGRQTGKICHQ